MADAQNVYEEIKNMIKEMIQNEVQPTIQQTQDALQQTSTNNTSNLSKLKLKLDQQRANDNITFSKPGHQDQFKHNTQVLETVEDALEAMEEADVEAMKESLEKGKKLLLTRIQHIKIADAYGWITVKEFKANELTSGEAEEKRLKRAIKEAEHTKQKLYKKPKFDDEKDKVVKAKTEQRSRMDDIICHNCKRVGHYVSHCPFPTSTLQSSSLAYSTARPSSSSYSSKSASKSTSTKSKSG